MVQLICEVVIRNLPPKGSHAGLVVLNFNAANIGCMEGEDIVSPARNAGIFSLTLILARRLPGPPLLNLLHSWGTYRAG